MNKRVIVTGGTGFIGSKLVEKLRTKVDYEVLATTNSVERQNKYTKKVDLGNICELLSLFKSFQPTHIVNLAAIANVMHSDVSEIYKVNIVFSENVLKAAKETCFPGTPVLMTSTAGVYGINENEYLNELLPLNPGNHYSYSKLVMEGICKEYDDYLDIKILRPFNIVGAEQNKNFLISKIVSHFARNAKYLKVGNIKSVRDYMSITDCVAVFESILENNTPLVKPLNICTGIGHSGEDVINKMENIAGYKINREEDNSVVRKNEIWRLVGDVSYLKTIVPDVTNNFKSLDDILVEMYSTYIKELQ